jgi:hypothetical protein
MPPQPEAAIGWLTGPSARADRPPLGSRDQARRMRRDGARVRCLTRNGYDWASRFPSIVEAAHRLKATSFRASTRLRRGAAPQMIVSDASNAKEGPVVLFVYTMFDCFLSRRCRML